MSNKIDDKLISELIEQSRYYNINIFESVVLYCDNNDVDPIELIKTFDEEFIISIKNAAISNNKSLEKFMQQRKHRKSFFEV